MTDQLRKAALDFLRLAIEHPKEHGYYAFDSSGDIFWYGEKPRQGVTDDCWVLEDYAPHKKQKILHWDSLLFTAEEVASAPEEPPQPEQAPSPKMGPFDLERFRNGELSYTEKGTAHRYLGTLSGKDTIACAMAPYDDPSREIMVERLPSELEQHTKMPAKTKKVYIHLWRYDSGEVYICTDSRSLYGLGDTITEFSEHESLSRTLIEIIKREVEV